jgi:DNA helicase-2/ATP-dependent DNA helicase PcrA
MHSAKGLEFKQVYLVGMEDGIFPSKMSINNEKEIEEERRLFYVALTRAEEKATLSYANNRYKWGVSNKSLPSRFIQDIDPKYLILPDYEPNADDFFEQQSTKKRPVESSIASTKRNLKKITEHNSSSNPVNQKSYHGAFQTGMKVEHKRFGEGKILQIEGEPPDTRATIFFNVHGQKQLLLKYAKLKIIS